MLHNTICVVNLPYVVQRFRILDPRDQRSLELNIFGSVVRAIKKHSGSTKRPALPRNRVKVLGRFVGARDASVDQTEVRYIREGNFFYF